MKASIIGIGKLGLCFALTLERAGYSVVGVDVSEEYVNLVNDKELKSSEPNVESYLALSKNFKATTSLEEAVEHSDLLFVLVATPSLPSGRYDHSQLDSLVVSLEDLGRQEKEKHFIVGCTPMPGYCESIKEKLNSLNYTVSYNPEFIAQGTILKNQEKPDMVLIGEASKEAGDLIQEVYEKHTLNEPIFCRMTPIEAEITKISLNCLLITKISFANMVGDIVLSSGGDPKTVLDAISADGRIEPKYLGYGFGYGGPCFPRDNRALSLYALDLGLTAPISVAADESNKKHLENQINHFIENSDINKEVIFDYVTYKKESTLLEESQQLAFTVELANRGYRIRIREREEVISQLKTVYGDLFIYERRD